MKQLLFILALILTGMSACQKGDFGDNSTNSGSDTTVSSSHPTPDTTSQHPDTTDATVYNPPVVKGSISGMIQPAIAATDITLTSEKAGHAVLGIKPGSDGHFRFTDVTTGKYVLRVHTTPAYGQPADIPVMLIRKEDLYVGVIQPELLVYGSITGTVVPANAIAAIRVLSPAGYSAISNVVVDPGTGAFKIDKLAAGNYTLQFTSARGFASQSDRTVTVANANSDLGAIQFAPLSLLSSVFCKVDGVATSVEVYDQSGNTTTTADRNRTTTAFSVVATYEAAKLAVTATILETIYAGLDKRTRTRKLLLNLDNVTGPGTYVCNETSASAMSHIDHRTPTMDPGFYYETKHGGSATVVITAIDPVTRTITGSFTGDLKGKPFYNNAIRTRQLTEGAFNIKY